MGTVIKKQKNRPAIRANMTSSPAKDGQPEAAISTVQTLKSGRPIR